MRQASSLAAGMKAAAAKTTRKHAPAPAVQETVLVGAHFDPAVSKALLMVRVKCVGRRSLKQLIGEAVNDLCAKYGVPEPYVEV